mgnify:CR=1 FL=1
MDALLNRLCETPGVSGRERQIRAVIREIAEATGFFDEIREDVLGNLLCLRHGQGVGVAGPRRILLAAHMDQAGFLVSHVGQDGAVYLHPVGTYDPACLASQPVLVVPGQGATLRGTLHLAREPVHTAPDARSDPTTLSDVFVELGLPPQKVAEQVRPGDMVVFDAPLRVVGEDLAGAGLDDRIGCWALLASLPMITNTQAELIFAFTVQEELGSRGAAVLGTSLRPDIALIAETVVSCCVPGVPPQRHVTRPGAGIALQVADSSLLSDESMIETAETATRAASLPVQRSLMQGGGQDGALLQRSGSGVRVLALGCPLRFMHTALEHAHRDDVSAYPHVLAALVNAL